MMMDAKGPVALIARVDETDSGSSFPIRPPSVSIGKSPDNDICISDDKTVSRRHCVIEVVGDKMFLEDANSTNGTYLEGRRVEKRTEIPMESRITVGRTHLFIIPAQAGYDQTSLIDASYAREESILIPSTGLFEQRTEAFLVVDVVKSTELLKREDDVFLIKLVATLGKILERCLLPEENPYLKCTGDGFLSRFGSADSAFNTSYELIEKVSRRFPEFVRIAIALHWGTARFREEEGLIGKHVHAVFALDALRGQEPEIGDLLEHGENRNLILMTEAFRNRLNPEFQSRIQLIGSYHLKGLEEEVPIYFVR